MNAIDLEVIYQSTLQIARELTLNMLRTGYSTIIKESQDFTFAIFDGEGRMVAQGIPQPLHIGPLAAQVNEIRRRFRDAIDPGDAFIVNHPYQACQNHATDVTVISPMFVADRLIGFIGNIAHKPDLGGKVPGTNSGDATDLFQEGLLIPPTKILRRGELNTDVEGLICANTRTPEVTWGDIKAQVNTNSYGLTKFAELFGKHGVDNVLACWRRWMELCESSLRAEIAKLPPGRYGPETDWLDDDGVDLAKPHRISASLEIAGDTLHFILDSDAQARGPINLRPCVSRNFIECLVKMIFIPELPVNDGLSRPVRVSYPPEGSLLNPRFPAPVNMYVRPSQVTTSVIMRVLEQARPGRVLAPGSAGAARPQAGAGERRRRLAVDRRSSSALRSLVFAIRDPQRRHRRAPRRRRRQRHGRARGQRHEHAGRGDRKRVSRPRRALRARARLRRPRDLSRRPRRAPAMARAGGRDQREPAHGPFQVLLPWRIRRQAGAALAGGAQSRRRRRARAHLQGRGPAPDARRRAARGVRRRRRLGRSLQA